MGIMIEVFQWAKSLLLKSDREALFEALEHNRIARDDLEFQIRQINESDKEIRRQLCQCAVNRRSPSIAGIFSKPKEDNVVPMRGPSLETRHPGIATDIARAERENT
jgi:hypothetical protein